MFQPGGITYYGCRGAPELEITHPLFAPRRESGGIIPKLKPKANQTMSLMSVPPGERVPGEVNVIIEIPDQTGPVKYEVDKKSGAVFVDRFLTTSMLYPCNYGYVPESLALDGDPLDVLVVTPQPLISGTVIPCRLIGLLKMEDEAGDDAKLLGVPADHLTRQYRKVLEYNDLPESQLATIEHFFCHYKDLEQNKWVQMEGWADAARARQELTESLERYRR